MTEIDEIKRSYNANIESLSNRVRNAESEAVAERLTGQSNVHKYKEKIKDITHQYESQLAEKTRRIEDLSKE